MMNPNLTSKRGNIVLELFPDSNVRTAKLRPSIIVQADKLETELQQVIVAMITSRLFRSRHQSRIVVKLSTPDGYRSGLLADSVIMTDNLATLATSEIDMVIGTLPMSIVDAALQHTLGL